MPTIPDCMAKAAERARFIGYPLAAALIEQRRAYGIATHGTPLAWPNGRDWLADWTQEALDAAAGYTTGLVAEMRQQGAPKHLIHGVLAHSTGALELIEVIEEWRRSAGLPDLLTQQPPPEGGHEAPDVARRELAAARARVAELEEAARWRPASERPEVDAPIELVWQCRRTGAALRAFGQLRADGLWCTDDYDPGIMDAVPEERILGWRPLGPGPEVTP